MSIINQKHIYVIVFLLPGTSNFRIGHCICQRKRLTMANLNDCMDEINEKEGAKATIINIIKIS